MGAKGTLALLETARVPTSTTRTPALKRKKPIPGATRPTCGSTCRGTGMMEVFRAGVDYFS